MAIVSKAVAGCALLATLAVAGCGSTVPAARPTATSSTSTPTATTTAVSSDQLIGQWIGQYCTQLLMDGETYAYSFAEAAAAMPSSGSADAQASAQELAQIASSVDASIENDVSQLTGSNPTTAAATSARTYLLNTYQTLHNALTAAKSQVDGLSTTNLQQFNASFGGIAATVSTSIQQSQQAIESYPAFTEPLRNHPTCK